jgi:hypothetical protein
MPRIAKFVCLMSLVGLCVAARAQNLDDTHASFANAIYQRNASDIHRGRPQALLRAVVVLHVKLDETGHWIGEVVRDNDQQPEMTRKALASVAALEPVREMSEDIRRLMRTVGFNEVWLFQNDGHFALRSLALPQLSQ